MAPIRAHHKSRTGCKTCRRRKVKCDEDSPVCKNCTRRQIECVWGDPPRSTTQPSTNLRALPSATFVSSFPSIMASTALDLQGIELMHQYTTSTCYTFCKETSALEVWKLTVPRIAILVDNSFLLPALLAVSALHLCTLNPSHPLALQYSCAALAHFNEAVNSIPSGDYRDADDGTVFIAQLLIGVYGFATSQSVHAPSDWLRILRTSSSTFRTRLSGLQQAVVAPLIPWITGPLDLSDSTETCHPFPYSLSTLAHPLYGSPDLDEIRDASVSATYQHAVCFLRRTWICSSYPDYHMHAAFFWLILSSDSFMKMLHERRPRALILFGHYCAIMTRLNGPWWTQRDWDAELVRMSSVLDDRWASWMDWNTGLAISSIQEEESFMLEIYNSVMNVASV
ncbi:hypothetical protein BDZ89DRAFT_1137627 [Hymenopellis radicata]|nr:hypothetical protein BDZ89DRAFT_1137627 [Hymenopellis radicata]